ncbi:MAG: hypothetical protein AAF433_09250 [Bacteroidota bacterium]
MVDYLQVDWEKLQMRHPKSFLEMVDWKKWLEFMRLIRKYSSHTSELRENRRIHIQTTLNQISTEIFTRILGRDNVKENLYPISIGSTAESGEFRGLTSYGVTKLPFSQLVHASIGEYLDSLLTYYEHYLSSNEPVSVVAARAVAVPSANSLNIAIQPGTAPTEVIAELLADISLLYRKAGGSGINFSFDGVEIHETVEGYE